MNVQLYCFLDRAAKMFGSVIQFSNDDMAKRGVEELANAGGSHPMFRYPSEFDLYRLGDMDVDTGVIRPIVPELVCRFSDYCKPMPVVSTDALDELVVGPSEGAN